MAKRRNLKQKVAKDFTEGTKERWIDAMPVRIDFLSPRAYVMAEAEGQDVRFSPCLDPATVKLLTRLNEARTSVVRHADCRL